VKKKGNRLTDMEFDEVSLVTRPANQLSKVVLMKSDTALEATVEEQVQDEEQQAEEVVAADTQQEISKGKKMKKKAIPAMDEEEEEEDEEDMEKMGYGKMKMKKDDDEIEIPAEVYDYIEALESANAELVESVEKLSKQIDDSVEAESEEVLKSADPKLVAIVKGLEERATAAEAIAKAERDHRLLQEFVGKAATLNRLPVKAEEFGAVLKDVADALTEEQFSAIWQVLSAANTNLSKSGMFAEIGKSTTVANDSTMSVIEKAAAALRQANPSLTREQSIARAVEADANLYTQYIREVK
jgi:hypothetical protein